MDSIAAVAKNNRFNPAPIKGIQKGPGALNFPGNFGPLNLNMDALIFPTKKANNVLQALTLIVHLLETLQLLCLQIRTEYSRITDIKPITAPISIMIPSHFIPIALTATDNGVALLRIVYGTASTNMMLKKNENKIS
ncbi:2081_t:CDS:2 [Gigaspora margarita]|uniref:2081_t:CDS:1 n=1 Tax=Gigaspora margarita TaxID=4874 RepID=A0ABN7WKQ2_GIGMA|nr:2081_t:CDS:2 [Gigaspora margarita]